MDIRKWIDKYSRDIQLVYNSENTRSNYISQVSCFLNHFKNQIEPKSISNDDIKNRWDVLFTRFKLLKIHL